MDVLTPYGTLGVSTGVGKGSAIGMKSCSMLDEADEETAEVGALAEEFSTEDDVAALLDCAALLPTEDSLETALLTEDPDASLLLASSEELLDSSLLEDASVTLDERSSDSPVPSVTSPRISSGLTVTTLYPGGTWRIGADPDVL